MEERVGLKWEYKGIGDITKVDVLCEHYPITCIIYEEFWTSYVTQGNNGSIRSLKKRQQWWGLFLRICA